MVPQVVAAPWKVARVVFFGKKNTLRLLKLQVATVWQAARVSYVEQLMQHIAGGGCAGVGVAKVLLWRCAGLILIYAACSTAQS